MSEKGPIEVHHFTDTSGKKTVEDMSYKEKLEHFRKEAVVHVPRLDWFATVYKDAMPFARKGDNEETLKFNEEEFRESVAEAEPLRHALRKKLKEIGIVLDEPFDYFQERGTFLPDDKRLLEHTVEFSKLLLGQVERFQEKGFLLPP